MFERTRRIVAAPAAVAVALAVGACSESTSLNGPAHVTILLTDAPVDYIDEAMVDIGEVVLIPADGGDHVVLSEDGTDGPVNLLELQDAATEILADVDIEPGAYSQLRLIVESASVTLADDYQFVDGSTEKDLTVPSGAQTGIKLLLSAGDGDEGDAPLEIPSGDLLLLVDFDVSQSFVIQGNPETPAGIRGVLFKPTLRVVVLNVAGSISGSVSTDLDSARVDSLQVVASPAGPSALEEFQTQIATGRTDANGDYSLPFVVPGTYSVKVMPADTTLDVDPDSVIVEVDLDEDVIGVDFELDTIAP